MVANRQEKSTRRRVVSPTRPRHHPTLPPPVTAPVAGIEAPPVRTAEVIAQRPLRNPITVSAELVVEGDIAEELWEMYRTSIGPLDQVAALKHLDSRDDILGLLSNPGITKVIAWDGDEPLGLGLITNDFELVPEASPDFFKNTYPEHAARGTLFYGMAVLVKESARGLTAFSRLYLEMWQIPALVGGVLIFDVCKFNRDVNGGDAIIDTIAANFPDASCKIVDQQTWFAAELPHPLP